MSDETEVLETPNWLLELEAKRERRLKARLGHETGAGAACLKCGDKCPGLDLHFWRKCCKACKCSKEEHAVPDDDIYGWAEFQLLGSTPNRIKRKILLPGKKDEIELDWAPKGNNETVDRYLKTLPPDQLPVKGSQAAQDRKQLLHKQIPIHDIDPALCHDLTNDELSKMNEYIAHVKKSSVGVGRIVSLSNIIKGNLHMLNPSEAALISSRFPKGIPLSDVVKLCAQDKANDLSQGLQKIGLHSKALPNHVPNNVTAFEKMYPLTPNKICDISNATYPNEIQQKNPKVQYSTHLPCRKNVEAADQMPCDVVEKYPHNPNFDPKKVPSQFLNENNSSGETLTKKFLPEQIKTGFNEDEQLSSFGLNHGCGNASAFVPYSANYSPLKPNYSINPQGKQIYSSESVEHARYPGCDDPNLQYEDLAPAEPGFSRNLSGKPTPKGQIVGSESCSTKQALSKQLGDLDCQSGAGILHIGRPGMQNVIPAQYNIHSDTQTPVSVPKSIKDLAFSTYGLSDVDLRSIQNLEKASEPYLTNRHLVKEALSNAHPILGDRNVIPDVEMNTDDTSSTGQVKCSKKLSEIFPNRLGIHEDFVRPSDVRIGAIRDIDIEYPENRSALESGNDFCDDYSPETIKEILNNIKLPDCHYCKKPFEENEFAVTIDRANVLFHARCFKCAGCNQMIVDNMYFYHKETDNIYCGRDYAKVRGVPRCKACDELIFTKEYTLAENATFHLKHFCCIECDTPLADRRYTLDDGMPYCLPCFEQSKANKCSGCLNAIKPDEIGCNLNGIHFHADDDCFACIVCKKPLMGEKLLLRNEKLYCSHVCYGLVK